jgi:hypothetical protein
LYASFAYVDGDSVFSSDAFTLLISCLNGGRNICKCIFLNRVCVYLFWFPIPELNPILFGCKHLELQQFQLAASGQCCYSFLLCKQKHGWPNLVIC